MTVQDVCDVVDALAPPGLAYSWDRCGLHTGDPEDDVRCVLVALTVTREAFNAARRARAQLIVAHHPLIWEPLKTLRADDPHTRLCIDLAQSGIACYGAHTNLDVVPGGVNTAIAERLKLRDVSPLLPAPQARQVKLVTFVPASHLEAVRNAVCAAGAGAIGDYTHCSFSAPGTGTFLPNERTDPFSGRKFIVNEEPELRFEVLVAKARLADTIAALKAAHPYEEVAFDVVVLENHDASIGLGAKGHLDRVVTLNAFAKLARRALGAKFVRVVGAADARVHSVGVIGGSGGGEIARVPGTVDVLVTGDVDYHAAQGAQSRGLALIDVGHAAAEKWIVPTLAAYLKPRLKKVRVVTYMEPELFRVVTE
ncbi:MAG: Nif3-like dinuclear metal center hexameric protein [Candidatus Hydrogenedentes bacterium]|nr:Nif3-like dinuclear metal center hexameric protein [Candidatus Hydrogenedentota bacterium]